VRITIDGQEIRAVNLHTARGRDLIALQTQTGYGLDEIVAMTNDKSRQTEVNKFIEFLSEHNRGKFVTWDEVLDRPMAYPQPDPGDVARAEPEVGEDGDGDGDGEVPTPASTGSPTVDAAPAAKSSPAKARPRKSSSSGGTSRGSTSRSRPASSK
jgi:hypothetical protein